MTGDQVAIVEKLSKRFAGSALPALDAISFSIKSGQVTSVRIPTMMRTFSNMMVRSVPT